MSLRLISYIFIMILLVSIAYSDINVRLNSRSDIDCDDKCDDNNEDCLDVGTNASGTDNKKWIWSSETGCVNSPGTSCSSVMTIASKVSCGGNFFPWTNCKCETRDTCTYVSGDWHIEASDYCVISDDVVMDTDSILFFDTTTSGALIITGSISGFDRFQHDSAKDALLIIEGGQLYINGLVLI